eukprot:COSAG03_NODE_21690_length_301_cov_0.509901_1_plen_69_part_00
MPRVKQPRVKTITQPATKQPRVKAVKQPANVKVPDNQRPTCKVVKRNGQTGAHTLEEPHTGELVDGDS